MPKPVETHPATIADAVRSVSVVGAQVTGLGPIGRLYTQSWAHWFVPSPVAVGVASLQGRLRWHVRSSEREAFTEWAETTLDGRGDERDWARLGKKALIEEAIRNELVWRPWRAVEIEGHERLRAIHESGRGVVLAFPILGPISGLWDALAASGFRTYVIRKPQKQLPPGRPGARYLEPFLRAEGFGHQFLPTSALSEGQLRDQVLGLLGSGAICMVPLSSATTAQADAPPGSMFWSDDAAALATAADVPLVPAFVVRRRSRPRVSLLDPLEPEQFADADALQERLAAVADELVAAHLAQVYPYRPLTRLQAERREARRSEKQQERARQDDVKQELRRRRLAARSSKKADANAKREQLLASHREWLEEGERRLAKKRTGRH